MAKGYKGLGHPKSTNKGSGGKKHPAPKVPGSKKK